MTDNARIIRSFVDGPSNPKCWLRAWDLTLGIISKNLRVWESRGRRLPLSLFAGEQCYRDLAIEVIYELFVPDKSGNYPLVKFLRPHTAEPDDIFFDNYLAIIRKTARQNVHKLEQAEAPDAWNIRRNIRHALRDSNREFHDESDGRFLAWSWSKANSPLRHSLPPVDDTTLHTWVTLACREETHTPGQCRRVFAQLDDDDRFRNVLLYYPLVKTFVTVLLDHQPSQETSPESPLSIHIRGLIRSAAPAAQNAILTNDLPHLAQLAGLKPDEVKSIEKAIGTWLADWAEHFDNDSLRKYLCEQLGEIPLPVYQKRYHYLWNTLTAKCKERILKDVRKRMHLE